jgi:hypothetical protein
MKGTIITALGIAALLLGEMSLAAPPPKRPMPGKGPNSQDVDYEFNVLADVKVRLLNPPVEFDDKGRPKKLDSEESRKRKGDTPAEQRLPGIKSDFNVLKPGDVVQVSFSRPKNPKDLENTTWSAISGQMVGVITNVDSDKETKLMTVRVSPNGPPQGGDKGGGRMKQRGEAGSRSVIKPEQRQASVIVIVEQAPEPENRGKGFKKKKT